MAQIDEDMIPVAQAVAAAGVAREEAGSHAGDLGTERGQAPPPSAGWVRQGPRRNELPEDWI